MAIPEASTVGETLLGAGFGALVGSILGYLGSFQLTRRSRRDDLEERRRRLLRALQYEVSEQLKPLTFQKTGNVTTSIYLSALDPLIDLVAAEPDEELLRKLVRLKSRCGFFNDVVALTNPVLFNPGPTYDTKAQEKRVESIMTAVEATYLQVRAAAALVAPDLQIRR